MTTMNNFYSWTPYSLIDTSSEYRGPVFEPK